MSGARHGTCPGGTCPNLVAGRCLEDPVVAVTAEELGVPARDLGMQRLKALVRGTLDAEDAR
jgi:hypothetical protein